MPELFLKMDELVKVKDGRSHEGTVRCQRHYLQDVPDTATCTV